MVCSPLRRDTGDLRCLPGTMGLKAHRVRPEPKSSVLAPGFFQHILRALYSAQTYEGQHPPRPGKAINRVCRTGIRSECKATGATSQVLINTHPLATVSSSRGPPGQTLLSSASSLFAPQALLNTEAQALPRANRIRCQCAFANAVPFPQTFFLHKPLGELLCTHQNPAETQSLRSLCHPCPPYAQWHPPVPPQPVPCVRGIWTPP